MGLALVFRVYMYKFSVCNPKGLQGQKRGKGLFGEKPEYGWLYGTVRLNNINLLPWHGKKSKSGLGDYEMHLLVNAGE